MTLEEEGGYVRLLSSCWLHGSIPSDPVMIARLLGKGASTTLATNLAAMFQPHPEDGSKLVHDRLEKERAKQDLWRTKSAEGGHKSAEARQKKRDSRSKRTVVEPPLNHPSNQNPTLLSSVFRLPSSVSVSSSGAEERGAIDREKERTLPSILASHPGFRASWETWLVDLAERNRGKLPTSHQLNMHLQKLAAVAEAGGSPIEAINNAISRGLREPDLPLNGGKPAPRNEPPPTQIPK